MASRAVGGVWQFSTQPAHRHHADQGAIKPAGSSRRRWEPRHNVVIACFLATLTMYVERVGFSIAYTAMAKEAEVDEALKGTVLSAFYWGYAISQVLLGSRARAKSSAPGLPLPARAPLGGTAGCT